MGKADKDDDCLSWLPWPVSALLTCLDQNGGVDCVLMIDFNKNVTEKDSDSERVR